jgi:hypothetical protein
MRLQAGQAWARIAVVVAVACTRDPETQGQFAAAGGGVDQGDAAGLAPDGEVEAAAETQTMLDMAQDVPADAPPDVLAEIAADVMPEAMVDADEVPDTTPDIPAEVPDATPDLPEVTPDVPPDPDVPVDTPPDLPDLADTADPCAKAGACDDKNPCTQELCDPAKGCVYPPAKSGSPCADDGLTCTADLCDGLGMCTHKLVGCLIKGVCAAVGPNPANPCEKCIAGQKIWTGTGGSCSDGDPCTVGDYCGGSGTCLPGAVTSCDDGNACSTDSCDKGKGCVQVNGPDGKVRAAGAGCTVDT